MMALSCEGNKGNWVALYIFGALKLIVSFILVVVGLALAAHSKVDCEDITRCYTRHGYEECAAGELYGCWTKGKAVVQCDQQQEFLSDMSTNFGIALLIGGIVGLASGCLGGLSAHQKLRRWLGISMGLDVFLMVFAVLMFLICSTMAGQFEHACQVMGLEGSDGTAMSCWEQISKDMCAWSGQFATATLCFLLAFLVELGSAITDCTACCCCPPADAHWAMQGQSNGPIAADGGAIVVGNPIGASTAQPPVILGDNKLKVVD